MTSLADASEDAIMFELLKRGVILHVGWAYPAMASSDEATSLIHEHGYQYGPWQFMEFGERAAEPPSWKLLVYVPEHFRKPVTLVEEV